jgi:hypothetical protein
MKRIVAFLAAVCVSSAIGFAASAWAQNSPTPPPPPPPTDASGDTLRAGSLAAPPGSAPAAADTAAQAARARRVIARSEQMTYVFSLGIGSGVAYHPDRITDDFSTAFGGMMSGGVRKHGITLLAHFGYNFFLANGTTPNDLSVLTAMVELRYSPVHSKARPYILVCGGLYRQWIVDLDYTETVLGYGGGAGVEVAIGDTRRLFLDGRYVTGQTREFDELKSNTEIIPMRLGLSWEFR